MIKHRQRIHSCTERTAGSPQKYAVSFCSHYMFLSTFKKSLNLLSQHTLPGAQVIAREREEEAAFFLKVKTAGVSKHCAFNMIILKSLSTHSTLYHK